MRRTIAAAIVMLSFLFSAAGAVGLPGRGGIVVVVAITLHGGVGTHAAFASPSSSSSRRRPRPPPSSQPPPPPSSSSSRRNRPPPARGGAKGRPTPTKPPSSSHSSSSYDYHLVHKPFNVLCQFSAPSGQREGGGGSGGPARVVTLADVFGRRVARDVYPVGRLDADSEGLLVLTNDPRVNARLLDPSTAHRREYHVQVEGAVTEEALARLRRGGLELNLGKGKVHKTLPCEAEVLLAAPSSPLPSPAASAGEEDDDGGMEAARRAFYAFLPPGIGPRDPPVRFRRSIPTTWLRLQLVEGKNRQVRRMTAAVDFPTLRLVRWAIEDLTLEGLAPGEMRTLTRDEMYKGLRL